ncbi:hypothetical protein [Halolamina rubra]|uniref:hypothetical protein n=1 Tax=Halolamina rubra TaxID=1380430 RepID=UPI0012ABB27E|nr:hypothetical protein [Halolamina rubra]
MTNRSIITLSKRALKEPKKSTFYIKSKISRPIAELHSKTTSKRYKNQKENIRCLREADGNWLLIVLDSCRFDRFSQYFEEFFRGDIEPNKSAAVDTFRYVGEIWPDHYEMPYITAAAPITNTNLDFNTDNIANTRGVAASGKRLEEKYGGYVPKEHIQNIVEVWRTDWDEDLGVCPPEPVTNKAIDIHEKNRQKNMVVHYFQPHAPYIGKKKDTYSGEIDEDIKGGAIASHIWQKAKFGDLTREELLELYDSNLRRVMESAAILINNTNFDRTVIIGDHGEALGEYNMYGHGFEHPYVRIVPWAEIEETKISPEKKSIDSQPTTDTTVEERLSELGYI